MTVRLVEEMLVRPALCWCDAHRPPYYGGWRRYRIEYGFECGCFEGMILLPPGVKPEQVEELFETERPGQ